MNQMIFLNGLYFLAHICRLILLSVKIIIFFPLLLYCPLYMYYLMGGFFQARKPSGPMGMEDALFSGNSVEDHIHLVSRLGSAKVSSKTTDTRPLTK